MTRESMLSAELVRSLLRYEPDTGRLFWIFRPRELFASQGRWKSWNAKFGGAEAFTARNSDGYLTGAIFCRPYRAHRLIWLIQTGEWPSDEIDHINGVRDDNRWENLQAATRTENMHNRARSIKNTSGVNGVFWSIRERKWHAQIKVDGRHRTIGYFDTMEAAADARAAEDFKHGFSARHGEAA